MQSRAGYYYLFLAVLALALMLLYLLMRGRAGRFWLAIRDDATGAESRGINVVRYKTIAFALSCALCGVAGSLYGTFSQLVSPELGPAVPDRAGDRHGRDRRHGNADRRRWSAPCWCTSCPSGCAEFGDVQLIVFSLAVIIFARFFRAGLWGIVSRAHEPAQHRGAHRTLRRRGGRR